MRLKLYIIFQFALKTIVYSFCWVTIMLKIYVVAWCSLSGIYSVKKNDKKYLNLGNIVIVSII